MISHLLDTVGPVFLLVLMGHVAASRSLFDGVSIDALMRYAIKFAIPCLLFRAVSTIDLGTAYDWRSLVAFYIAALMCFGVAIFTAWRVFARRPGEAVAVGFAGLFSNLVLLGLPVVRMTLGEGAMPAAYALVSVHAPFCYLVGIFAMEMLRADGRAPTETVVVVVRAMFSNSLMIGIGLGFLANFASVSVPGFVAAALDMIANTALPLALFGFGGVIARFSLSTRMAETSAITAISLLLHPLLALAFCVLLGVDDHSRVIVVLMASMSPGVNAYLFASMYGRGEDTAAAAVLLGTGMAVLSVTLWSWLLVHGSAFDWSIQMFACVSSTR